MPTSPDYIKELNVPLKLDILNNLDLDDYDVLKIQVANNDTNNSQEITLFGDVIGTEGDQPINDYLNTGNDIPQITFPTGVAVDSQGNTWVLNASAPSGTVRIFDTNDVFVTSVIVGEISDDIIYNSANDLMYVSNTAGGSVTVINATTRTVITTVIGLAGSVSKMTIHSPTNNVFVIAATVVIVIGTDNSVLTTIALTTDGSAPAGIVYNPINDRVYASNNVDDSLDVINPNSFVVETNISLIPTGGATNALVFNPIRNKVYAFGGTNIVSIDTNNVARIAGTSPTGSTALRATFNSRNNRMYASDDTGGTVTVMSSDEVVESSITVGSAPFGIVFNNVNNNIYVANLGDTDVSVLSPTIVISGTTPYTQVLRETSYDPILLKHLRYISGSPTQLRNRLVYNHQSPTGKIHRKSYQPTQYIASLNRGNNIAEIYAVEDDLIYNKGYYTFSLDASESVTLMWYYKKEAQWAWSTFLSKYSLDRDLIYSEMGIGEKMGAYISKKKIEDIPICLN